MWTSIHDAIMDRSDPLVSRSRQLLHGHGYVQAVARFPAILCSSLDPMPSQADSDKQAITQIFDSSHHVRKLLHQQYCKPAIRVVSTLEKAGRRYSSQLFQMVGLDVDSLL